MSISRRKFIKITGVAAATLGISNGNVFAKTTIGRVVVIGGGFGGATAARYIRKLDPRIEVTLVEPNPHYTSCPFGNSVVAGFLELKSITHTYDTLREVYGINVIHDYVVDVDPLAKNVRLRDGETLDYDRLVMSPGIDFRWDAIEGYDEETSKLMPHAWKGAAQIQLLQKQLQAMPSDGVVVIAPPEGPYRCPPGPYERASLIAHYLQRHKPRAKVVILDGKSSFSKSRLFKRGWSTLYPRMVEWISSNQGGEVVRVDVKKSLLFNREGWETRADVASVIPPQKAAKIAHIADLVDESGWCPVEQRSFESTRHAAIHVIGDSAIASPMPKSGYAANSQAKVVALAVVAHLNGNPPGEPSLINTCFSFIAPEHAVSVSGVYAFNNNGLEEVQGSGGMTSLSDNVKAEARYAHSWYKNIIADTFG